MAIAFPTPARIHLPSKFQNAKQPTDLPAKIANIAAEEAGDTGTIGSTSKIIRAITKILSATKSIPKEIGDSIVSHLTSVIDTFKVLSIFKSIKTIVDNSKKKDGETKSEKAQRMLKIAGATTGIGVAAMTGVRLLENFKLLKIADISKAMGITSLASAPLKAALSFPVVFSAVEILENAFTIAGSSLRMHDINKRIKLAKERVNLWKPDQPSKKAKNKPGEPIDFIAAGKLHTIPLKIEALQLQAQTILAPQVEKTKDQYTEAKINYDKIKKKTPKTFGAKLSRKCALKKAEMKLKRAAQKHTQACKKFDVAKGTFDKLGTKLERWKVIENKYINDTFTDKDKEALKTFKENKEQKWKLKIKNITWDKVKEGLSLGMAVFLTIFLITSIALAIAFPVALPLGAIIGLAVGGLLISTGFMAKHLLPKFMESEKWGKKPVKPVEVPELEKVAVLDKLNLLNPLSQNIDDQTNI